MKWQNQKSSHIKRMDNNCHIPDLVQAYSYVENGGLNLVRNHPFLLFDQPGKESPPLSVSILTPPPPTHTHAYFFAAPRDN